MGCCRALYPVNRAVIFLHIPKAAGTTFTKLLSRQVPPDQRFDVGKQTQGEALEELKQRSGVRLVTGHCGFGLHTALAVPATYLTVLREPIDRLVSAYFYARENPKHRLHLEAATGGLTLLDLARRSPNVQTRYLAGDAARPETGDLLALAKENVEKHFALAGLAERFDETVVLTHALLGWPVRPFRRENITARRPRADTLSSDDLAVLRQTQALDLELYQWARDRFDAQVAAQSSGFRSRLRALRLANRVLSWIPRAFSYA